MCWKKLLWVRVSFNLLYERGGEGKGMGQGEGEGGKRRSGGKRQGGNKRRSRRKTVRSRKITQVWELLSISATYSIRKSWFSDLIVQ